MGLGGTRSALGVATFVAAFAVVASVSPDAHAQRAPTTRANKEATPPNKAHAADLFKKSADAYLRGEFAQAIALLDEAYALDPQPVLLYNKARAHEGLGHIDEAISLYERYLTEEPSSPDRGAIEQRLVTLRRQRDEKTNLVKERTAVEQDRAAVERERAAVAAEPPPEPPRKRSVAPYVVMGAGGVGLVVGTVFGFKALSRKSSATDEPTQQKAIDLRDSGKTFATVSNVSFVVGAVLVAGGAVWWVLDGTSTRRRGGALPPVQLGVGPGAVHFAGTF